MFSTLCLLMNINLMPRCLCGNSCISSTDVAVRPVIKLSSHHHSSLSPSSIMMIIIVIFTIIISSSSSSTITMQLIKIIIVNLINSDNACVLARSATAVGRCQRWRTLLQIPSGHKYVQISPKSLDHKYKIPQIPNKITDNPNTKRNTAENFTMDDSRPAWLMI